MSMHFIQRMKNQAEQWVPAGEELRLLVCGYIRPEQNFTGLEALIARIHEDGRVSSQALDQAPFHDLENDPFLSPG